MAHDVPADVQDVLTQLHEAAVEAAVMTAGDSSDEAGDDAEATTGDDAETAAEGDTETTTGDDAETTTDGDTETATDDVPEAFAAPLETARTVASNKLPAGELRNQFTHGYDRALAVAAAEPAVAAEYVRAVDRRLAAATDRSREGVAGGDPEELTDSDEPGDTGDPSGPGDSDESDDPDEDL